VGGQLRSCASCRRSSRRWGVDVGEQSVAGRQPVVAWLGIRIEAAQPGAQVAIQRHHLACRAGSARLDCLPKRQLCHTLRGGVRGWAAKARSFPACTTAMRAISSLVFDAPQLPQQILEVSQLAGMRRDDRREAAGQNAPAPRPSRLLSGQPAPQHLVERCRRLIDHRPTAANVRSLYNRNVSTPSNRTEAGDGPRCDGPETPGGRRAWRR